MLDWLQLVHLSDADLARLDIARVNLACAAGLPGSDQIDEPACLDKLDYWARCVKQYTERVLPHFRRKRYDYNNSEAYFRILTMVTVLQRDLGMQYNAEKIPEHVPLELADTFIHGTLLGQGGTCASIPVTLAAVGRRLGYPIKLVSTRSETTGHCFARWHTSGGETFNIEAAGHGCSSFDDDYYRTGRYELTPEMEAHGGYLRSKTPKEELASFLADRANYWLRMTRLKEAAEAFTWSSCLVPYNKVYPNTAKIVLNQWLDEINARKPAQFPNLHVRSRHRHFPETLPLEIEQALLALDATEHMLDDPDQDRRWWKPLREGAALTRAPRYAYVDISNEGYRVTLDVRPCQQESNKEMRIL